MHGALNKIRILDASTVIAGPFAAGLLAEERFHTTSARIRNYTARKNLVEVEHPDFGTLKVPSAPPVLSKTPGEIKWIGPALGQHVDEVFKGLLGMSDADIARLREAGAI